MATKSDKIIELVNKVINKPKEWRWGQAYYNYAYELWPHKVEAAKRKGLDPFEINDLSSDIMGEFIQFVTED